jgi:16S rRNA (adenine1518-N6/adenine1519-N6)-dimethyltransferase
MAHQARKRFGQHFLTDVGCINAIVAAIRPDSSDRVIEIGPGLGAMTLPLMDQLGHMEVVEIDRDLVAHWQKKNLQGLTIHQADALKFDFRAWARECKEGKEVKEVKEYKETQEGQQNKSTPRVKIVGNLPYNISSPLLFHLIDAIDYVDEQVFMLQLEVVERMVAKPGSSDYGRLSVMLQARYHMENRIDVPPEAFDPPPKVDSAVVEMIPNRDQSITQEVWTALEKIVQAAFAQRRKMLANNLGEFKEKLQLDEQTLKARAQDISVQTYIEWAKQLA